MAVIRFIFCLFFSLLLTTGDLVAQDAPSADSAALADALKNTVSNYQQYISWAAPLYSGPEYVEYYRRIYEGHAFIYNAAFVNGSVVFDGILYENIPVKYDLLRNVLVIKGQNQGSPSFTPDIEKISYFTLGDHAYTKLKRDAANVLESGARFYEVLYAGKEITLLKKENKTIEEELNPAVGLRRTVISSTNFYLKKDNAYFLVNRNRQILSALRDKEKELRDFIRSQDDDANTDHDKRMIGLAVYYESLYK